LKLKELFGDEELSEKGMGDDCDDLSEGEMVLHATDDCSFDLTEQSRRE